MMVVMIYCDEKLAPKLSGKEDGLQVIVWSEMLLDTTPDIPIVIGVPEANVENEIEDAAALMS